MMNGFTVKSLKHRLFMPDEDAYQFSHKNLSMAVADGITRDPCYYLPDIRTFFGKIKWIIKYPSPSPAGASAGIFVKAFNEFLMRNNLRDSASIANIFKSANERIKEYNAEIGITPISVDFITKDYAACVASGIFINEDNMSYGFISDCGVAIFRPDKNDFAFVSENEGPDKHEKYITAGRNEGVYPDWREAQARIITRSIYRNNPSEPHSYGALTGQDEAMYYLTTGNQELKRGDIVLAYSDGLADIVRHGSSIDFLREKDFSSLRKYCKKNVRNEGTLVYFVND